MILIQIEDCFLSLEISDSCLDKQIYFIVIFLWVYGGEFKAKEQLTSESQCGPLKWRKIIESLW